MIGTDIIRFDIYGTDVVLANKMESEGEKNRVNVSETTKKLLEAHYSHFDFEFNKIVSYGDTHLPSYFIKRKLLNQ